MITTFPSRVLLFILQERVASLNIKRKGKVKTPSLSAAAAIETVKTKNLMEVEVRH